MNREHWHICTNWEQCTEDNGADHCVCQVPHEHCDGYGLGCDEHPDAVCRPFELIWVE